MTKSNDRLNEWLADAYAMKRDAARLLAAQSARMNDHPVLQTRFELHLRETDEQLGKLEAALENRVPSRIVKSPARAAASRRGSPMSREELLKFAIDLYASKYREIAAFRVLLTAAEAADDEAIGRLCGEMLWQEDAMAAWLRLALPEIARQRLAEKDAPAARRQLRHAQPGQGQSRHAAH
jgi:ferritin-like metal-binding protein YciE